MNKNLIIFMHLLSILYMILYAICTHNNKYDYIYIVLIYFTVLHWTFFKGECLLSYYFKKIENKHYELGLNNTNDDLDYIFGNYKLYIIFLIIILFLINIFIISNRNNIEKYYIFLFIFMYIFYLCGKQCFKNRNTNANFQLFNDIMKILLILFSIYFYRNNRKFFNIK